MYDKGQGVVQNFKEALVRYRKAADQGYTDEQRDLGLMCNEGQGVPRSYKEAAVWSRKVAD